MKILLSGLLLFVLLSSLPSCTKDTTTTVVVTDHSTLGLFTGKQWIFDSVYDNYTGTGTGTLIYARGANNNSVNLDKARTIFWRDGTEDDFNYQGIYIPLLWSFVNGDSTEIYAPPYPTYVPNGDYARILKLDATHLTFYDSTNSAKDIFIFKP